jgi:hypothetical protein
MPRVTIKKTAAKVEPIIRMRVAWTSSGLRRRDGLWSFFSKDVASACSSRDTLRLLAFWLLPVLVFLAFIANPALITTSGKPDRKD